MTPWGPKSYSKMKILLFLTIVSRIFRIYSALRITSCDCYREFLRLQNDAQLYSPHYYYASLSHRNSGKISNLKFLSAGVAEKASLMMPLANRGEFHNTVKTVSILGAAIGAASAPEFGETGSNLGRSNSPTALGQPILAQKCSKLLKIAQKCPKLTYKAPDRLSGLSTHPETARNCAIILVVAQKWPKSTSNVSPCWGGPPYWPQTPKIAMNGKLAKSLQMLSTRSYQEGCSMIRLFDHYFGVTSCIWTSAL